MTPQIKDRIEQIRRGEVPEGYKRTKVGIVPKEWEQSRLTQYLTVSNEKNADLKYGKEDVFSISGDLGIVNQIELLGRSYAGVSVAPYGVVYPNDIVYTKSPLKANPYGIIKTNLTGKIGLVSTLYAVYHPTNKVCPLFVNYYFGHDKKLNDYLHPIVNIGAKHDMKISDENALKGYVAFPPLPEQEKIAEILTAQDRVIALLDQKIEQLQKMKKVFLQKMFPAKGQTVPEWRFKGFTAPWEQRKVADIASETRGGGTPKTSNEAYWTGDIPWIQSSDLTEGKVFGVEPRKHISMAGLNGSATQFVPENSIAVVTRVGVGKLAFMPYSYTTSQDFLSLCRLQTEPIFTVYGLYQMLQGELSSVQGTSIKGMTKEDLLSKVISVPNSTDEQAKIGTYFKGLDNLITLHQRKRDEEKRKKKALMQLLLTGIVRTKEETNHA